MDGRRPRLSVIGLGRLGAPIAACFAARGFVVVGADVDPAKVEKLAAGVPPVAEPGLGEVLRAAGTRLRAAESVEDAVAATDVTFVIVPTPSEADGRFSLRYVLDACRRIGCGLAGASYHLVVVTSTVMPGATGGPILSMLVDVSRRRYGEDFGLCYNPVLVALGTVIRDFLSPDFVLVGESDRRAGGLLERIYRDVCENRPPVARMNFANAELAKLAVNTFVTSKISFANFLARVCERLPETDVDVVTSALGMDSRIGLRCLRGRISYGGPCFPRDNQALAALAAGLGVPADLPEATDRFNRWQLRWLADVVIALSQPGTTVGILGLSYKPGSDVVEESPGVRLAADLVSRGRQVLAYDPVAMTSAKTVLPSVVHLASSLEACVGGSDVVVLTTPWPEFAILPPETWRRNSPSRVVVDCWRMVPGLAEITGVRYVPIGYTQESNGPDRDEC